MKTNQAPLWLSLVLAGCSVASDASDKQKDSSDSRITNGIFNVDIEPLDSVEVGVVDTQGNFLFLRRYGLKCPGLTYVNGHLAIDLNNAIGAFWTANGVRVDRQVFDKHGKYKVLVSDNLETELENSASTVFSLQFEPTAHQGAVKKSGACIETP